MYFKTFCCLFLLLLVLPGQIEAQDLPVSLCPGNCIHCSPKEPEKCLPLKIGNNEYECGPFAQGENCQDLTNGYVSAQKEEGTFTGWGDQSAKVVTCEVQEKSVNVGGKSYKGIGPYKPEVIQKVFSLTKYPTVEQVVFKFTVAVDDPGLLSGSNNTGQQEKEVKQGDDGSLIEETKRPVIELEGIEFSDPPLLGIIILDDQDEELFQRIAFYAESATVQTSCGWIFQYAMILSLDKPYSKLTLSLQKFPSAGAVVTWTLLSMEMAVGCSGFTISSGEAKCSQCLTGFFAQTKTIKEKVYIEACVLCDFRCKTCISTTKCTSCIDKTKLNTVSRMCEYQSEFYIVTSFSDYEIVKGEYLKSEYTLINIIRVVETFIIIRYTFITFTTYYIKFYIIYSQASLNIQETPTILLNGQEITITRLSGAFSTYSKVLNNNTAKVYIEEVIVDLFHRRQTFEKMELSVKASKSSTFLAISNIHIVELKCKTGCKECMLTESVESVQCLRCVSFFCPASDCTVCGNGYFVKESPDINANQTDTCVKCHSTCKQCVGPSFKDCSDCFAGFELDNLIFDYSCINCIYEMNQHEGEGLPAACINKQSCLQRHPLSTIQSEASCRTCLNASSINLISESEQCRECWIKNKMAYSGCKSTAELGYLPYGTDINNGVINKDKWEGKPSFEESNCTEDYIGIIGVPHVPNSTDSGQLTFKQPSLPPHKGLSFFINLLKVNDWTSNTNDTGSISLDVKVDNGNTNSVKLNNSYGTDLCGGNGNEMLFTYTYLDESHTSTGQFMLTITSSSPGIYANQFQVFLGNCDQCARNQFTFQFDYIPRYSTKRVQTGLDIYLRFNKKFQFARKTGQTAEQAKQEVLRSFQFTIDKLGNDKLITYTEVEDRLNIDNSVRYFLPLNETFINGNVNINSTMEDRIFTRLNDATPGNQNPDNETKGPQARLLLEERLNIVSAQEPIARYQNIPANQRLSMDQMLMFFQFLQWFCLVAMIFFAFFGIGIVFEELSISVQLVFWHVYFSTSLQPASLKAPMAGLQNMQNLHWIWDSASKSIENQWFGDLVYPSDAIFQQYNVDIYFERTIYPTIIINLIFLIWFIILFICNKAVKPFRESQNKVIKFFRNIPQRPLNYIDQIWRYQFGTVMWASFLQFSNFDGYNDSVRLNLALCVISFVVALIWPIFIMLFTYKKNLTMNVNHFLYSYEDIYYRKISSLGYKHRHYFYIAIRFFRIMSYALFIAVFIRHEIIGPVILLIGTFVELVYILIFKIYRDSAYLAFKVIQNLLFMILQIMFLIVYGFSFTMDEDSFIDLGFAIGGFIILLVINAMVRWLYLLYRKVQDFIRGSYDIGDHGEKEKYDVNQAIPTSQRFVGK